MPRTKRASSQHDHDDAEHRATAQAWADDLVRALDKCDRLDATMVGLVYVGGLTHSLVAQRLALPLDQVNTGIARAMQCIGQSLTGGGTALALRPTTGTVLE
ncbi:MAG TPA: hypothetical protein VGN18_07390 [Jatrophihabitans sp.]|uniref:hypothetical protein n=1 Tax=Jatrophihabitans sp. TaxID=1932789 RepID=UPI002E08B047|nr:hypothetical protein [Jatrophihabitans sp.]